jgi:hypothetical protein
MIWGERVCRPLQFGFGRAVRVISLSCVLSGGWSGQAPAAGLTLGAQFQLNTYTTNPQSFPSVAADATGNFVVVWESFGSSGSDSSSLSIQGQRFSSAGVPVGTEFQVNAFTPSDQSSPSVAADASGNFVVAWTTYLSGVDLSSPSVRGRRFDSAGAPLGTEFQVNTYSTSFQGIPSVASDASGNFVVVWVSAYSVVDSLGAIEGQRFDSAGVPLGTEFQVNTYTTDIQNNPSVATDPAGNFVVVWHSYPASGADPGVSIQAQRFDSTGVPVGTEFQVNTYTTDSQYIPSVAMDGAGRFVVVWQSDGQDGSSQGVFGQRFDSSGIPVGTEFQVNTYTTSYQMRPRVATDPFGGFLVVWSSPGSTGSDSSDVSIQGRRFNSAGVPVGTEFQINTYTTSSQNSPSVAADPFGNFAVVWSSHGSSGSDSDESSIQGRFGEWCDSAPEPDSACRLADVTGTGKSSLQIKNEVADSKDSFKWKWNKGVATTVADFKMPDTATASYRLCVYDASGGPQPLLSADIPNGALVPLCGSGACWKVLATGFKYKNKGAVPAGITDVKFKAGLSGKAQVQVKGKGSLLRPPATATLVTDVVVQLLIDDGITTECFKTAFPSAGVTVQDSENFKAKGP